MGRAGPRRCLHQLVVDLTCVLDRLDRIAVAHGNTIGSRELMTTTDVTKIQSIHLAIRNTGRTGQIDVIA